MKIIFKQLNEAKKTSLKSKYLFFIFASIRYEKKLFNNTEDETQKLLNYKLTEDYENFKSVIKYTPPEEFEENSAEYKICISWIINTIINYNDSGRLQDLIRFLREDIGRESKATQYFRDFFKFKDRFPKNKSRNLFDYDKLSDIYKSYRVYINQIEEEDLSNKISPDQLEFIFNDNNLTIIRPLTAEASCILGEKTEWCTAKYKVDDKRNKFNVYNDNSPLYIIKDKNNGELYQLHIWISKEEGEEVDIQLMDSSDSSVIKGESWNLITLIDIILNSKYGNLYLENNFKILDNSISYEDNDSEYNIEFINDGYIKIRDSKYEINKDIAYYNYEGKLHREDGPAHIKNNYNRISETYYINGFMTSQDENVPSNIVYSTNSINGKKTKIEETYINNNKKRSLEKGPWKISWYNNDSKREESYDKVYSPEECQDLINDFYSGNYNKILSKIPSIILYDINGNIISKKYSQTDESFLFIKIIDKDNIFEFNNEVKKDIGNIQIYRQNKLDNNLYIEYYSKYNYFEFQKINDESLPSFVIIDFNRKEIQKKWTDTGTQSKSKYFRLSNEDIKKYYLYPLNNIQENKMKTIKEGKFEHNKLTEISKDDLLPKVDILNDLCRFVLMSYQYGKIPNNISPEEEEKLEKFSNICMTYNEFTDNVTKQIGRLIKRSLDPRITNVDDDIKMIELYKNNIDAYIKHVLAICRYYKSKNYADLSHPDVIEYMKKYYI